MDIQKGEGMNNDYNEFYSKNEYRYYCERDREFLDQLDAYAKRYLLTRNIASLSMADFSDTIDNEFDFPDIDDWITSEYNGMLGDNDDRLYDEMRDENV